MKVILWAVAVVAAILILIVLIGEPPHGTLEHRLDREIFKHDAERGKP
jgi:hypothetical protein